MTTATKPIIETLLINDDYYEVLINEINKAIKSIDLEVYIFENDALGRRIAKALEEAAQRGLKIRVIVDGMGSPAWLRTIGNDLQLAGIEVRVFQPLPWLSRHWLARQSNTSILKKFVYLLYRINRRNHRKTCVIDGKKAFVGSANICINHLSEARGGHGWRDTSILLENVDVKRLEVAFEKVWNHFPIYERAKLSFQKVTKSPIFRLNYSRHQRRVLYKDLLRRIARSKKRIWITNAYFMPSAQLLKALIISAEHGIDVKILLPQKSDVGFYPLVTRLFYTQLLQVGAKIFEYKPSMLHAKTLTIDNFHLVGSSNLNTRSLMHDFEVDVMITLAETKQQLDRHFLADIKSSNKIDIHQVNQLSKVKKIFAWMLLYLRYWL